MATVESEWLEDPPDRKKYGWQVIVHDPEPRMSTMIGTPFRWRWMARRTGHVWRKWGGPGTRVEIRQVRRTDAPRSVP